MKNLIPTTEALDIVDFGLLAVRQTTQVLENLWVRVFVRI